MHSSSTGLAVALIAPIAFTLCACQLDDPHPNNPVGADQRFVLPDPGPMIPPVPAIVLGVKGDGELADDLSIVWTFVVEGNPPRIGISVPRAFGHRGLTSSGRGGVRASEHEPGRGRSQEFHR